MNQLTVIEAPLQIYIETKHVALFSVVVIFVGNK